MVLAASLAPNAFAAERAVTLTADSTRWHADDKVVATGNVTASFEDYKVTSDNANADLDTNIAVFEGNVTLTTKERTAQGKRLTINLKTKDWTFESATTKLGQETFKDNPNATAIIRTDELSGNEDEISVKSGSFTTCDLEHPHYCIQAGRIDIFPESRVVAHGVSFMGLDKKLFSISKMVIPIKGLMSSILPQVGSSSEEGYFMKASYAYMANANAQGFLKLDLMTRRGVGLGAEQTYRFTGASGLFNLYYLNDRELGSNNLTGSVQHQHKFGEMNLSLRGDYRSNSYLYYPSNRYTNYQLAMTRSVGPSSTSLTYNTSANDGVGNSDTSLASLRQTYQFNPKLSGRLSMDMRTYKSSYFEGTDEELESELEFSSRNDKFDALLVMSKRNDLDGSSYTGDQFYSSLDRLPELVVETDSYRLTDKPWLGLPLRLKVGMGRYHEMPSGEEHDRLLLQADLLNKVLPIGDRTDLSLSSGFKQTLYASDMAQQVLRANALLTTRYNDYLSSRFTYIYQRPNGYTPFRFDYAGDYNYMRAVVDFQKEQKLRWSLSSGYDLDRDSRPWQDMTFRLTANPSPRFGTSLSTGYDLNRGEWRSLISQVRYADPERLSLDLGTRYNLKDGSMDALRGRLALKIGDKWSADALMSWDGFASKWDYRAFRITRDLHCWEASLVFIDETGFRKDKGIRLDLRLKAFPGEDRFGIGQYGQTFDTGMGEYYY